MIVKKQKRKNRGWLLLVGAFVLLGFIEYVEADKKYGVYLTDPQWGIRIEQIEAAKAYLSSSDFPPRLILPLIDSLTSFQNEIRKQVIPQLPKTRPQPQPLPKKDTIPK